MINLAKSRAGHTRTPYNSSAGDARRTNPSLPLIRRAINSSVATVVNESMNVNHLGFQLFLFILGQNTGFTQTSTTNEITVAE